MLCSILATCFRQLLRLCLARLPEDVLAAVIVVDTCQHKEEIREAVQIDDDLRIDPLLTSQCHHVALGTATDGAGQMAPRGCCLTPGQNETRQRCEIGVEPID